MADRVTFTRPAAERIGKVVRIVETGDRDSSGWTVGVRATPHLNVKHCTWTGTWNSGSTHQISMFGGATATAMNAFFGWRDPGSVIGSGMVMRYSNTWRLRTIDLETVQGYTSISTMATPGHMLLGLEKVYDPDDPDGEGSGAPAVRTYLKWFEVAECSTTT